MDRRKELRVCFVAWSGIEVGEVGSKGHGTKGRDQTRSGLFKVVGMK